eukprot:3079489-Prymnesium_polylepis.1
MGSTPGKLVDSSALLGPGVCAPQTKGAACARRAQPWPQVGMDALGRYTSTGLARMASCVTS